MSYVATVVEFRNGNARKSKFKRTSINLTTSVTENLRNNTEHPQ